ncbi:MAG: aromatic ring-hydroxylating dioxygenase subunit alpha [Acidimicrobiaceae bacterium]|nr:aromatic ring-hydroxylating dioxygenase subunit alpha [Acidimicrobiaceae bacterium]
MNPFVLNEWYVAAWGTEVSSDPLARTICGDPIVFFRGESGSVTALADRCVHRCYPLSLGKVKGDVIECGYHGFTYDCSGTCVSVPGQTNIPRTARVKSYPVIEQGPWIWVWVGEPEKAASVEVPSHDWLQDNKWRWIGNLAHISCRSGLLVDNLMDLSHESYLHAGFIGTPEVAATPIESSVDHEAGIVRVDRHMQNVECPPFYSKSSGISGRIDRWQDIEYRPPCLYVLHSRVAPTGVIPNPDGSDPEAIHMKILYAVTPETENSTWDFYAVARDFSVEDDWVSEFLTEMQDTVVRQDVDALNVLEKVIESEGEKVRELSIRIDAGGLAARHMLKKMRER